MVSKRKLQANRRNAKCSTGPKDTRRTRYNAQKHGLLSQASIILDGDAKEDPAELESLRKALWEVLDPVGAMEEILVDRIVSCVWRLRRAQRADVGEIRLAADRAVMDTMDATANQFGQVKYRTQLGFVPASGEGNRRELARTTLGIAYILEILDVMEVLIEKHGLLTMDQLREARIIYGDRRGSFAALLLEISCMAVVGLWPNADEGRETRRDGPSPEICKEMLLELIDIEIARLKDQAILVAEREKLERDAAVLSRHLPSDEVLGKNLRYETAIDRQMYRALKELRELQAARRARSDNGV